jgi:hypothetical protein
MGVPRSRKRWIVGAVAAAIAVWLGAACLGACDLNPQPLPPGKNGLAGSAGDDLDATVGFGSSSGSSGGGSGSGGFSTGADGGNMLPVTVVNDAGADDGGGADVSMSPDAGGSGDAAADAGDAAVDAADAESDGSDAMSAGPDAGDLDGSRD